MTTTTSSFSHSGHTEKLFDRQFLNFYRSTIRENLLSAILYTVCLALITVLPTFYETYNSSPVSLADQYLLSTALSYALSSFFVPVLVAAVVFHYLHNRLSVDFYHSMPISRTKLFLTKYLSGLTLLLTPIALTKIACTICQLLFYSSSFSVGHILKVAAFDLFFWLAMNTVIFTLSCMVAVTTSNVIETIIYSMAVNGTVAVMSVLLASVPQNLYGVSSEFPFGIWLSPYGVIFWSIDNFIYATDFPSRLLLAAAVWLCIAVVCIYAAIRLYQRFHSEWAQLWGRQSVFTQVMKVLAGILMMFLLHYTVIDLLSDNTILSFTIASLIGAPLGFLLVEGVTGKGFSNLHRNLKYILLTLLLCLCCPAFLAVDGLGMVSHIPALDRIAQITVSPPSVAREISYLYSSSPIVSLSDSSNLFRYATAPDIVLTSERSKELVLQLHQNALAEQDYRGMTGNRSAFTYELTPLHSKMRRSYSFAAQDIPLLLELMCQPEYVEQSQPVFTYQPEYLGEVTCLNKAGLFAGEIDAEHYGELLEAARADLLSMTPDRLNDFSLDPVVGYLQWNLSSAISSAEGSYNSSSHKIPFTYNSSALAIRSSFHQTLGLLARWNLDPQKIPLDQVQSVTLTMPQYDGVNINLGSTTSISYFDDQLLKMEKSSDFLSWDVSDPQLIEQMIRAAGPTRTSPSCNPIVVTVDDSSRSGRSIVMYLENEELLAILKDSGIQIPYLLSAAELNDMLQHPDWEAHRETYRIDDFNLLDLTGKLSVAAYARQNSLDWFSGKTAEQLQAMEKTAFTYTDGANIFYAGYLGLNR